ncbi:MAG: GTPase ObgE [Synergistaceae bacterium]|jgi:GTP-binding protein|nr:GTPase ObgE [Synergistaceae bacterium]PKL05428.1 MAG: GTPase ObgE [Synergistetes bacterium HGW-Synergistetes-1]MBP9559451.1 GTPase ObgE [Synergistaceae bacterium]MBP9975812.1 GTPase ObgE [Synergistaceae bacterium]MCE5183442.1 GTPase ObgE [Synergistaceae bacterium]
MKFIDSMRLSVKAGRGGNGCMSFLRERCRPNGGPDGGNGGRGGSIIFEATTNLQTLADLESQRNIKGNSGTHGKGSARNGAIGEDTVVLVPCGTIVYDAMTNEGLADLVEPGDRFLAARGGRGGRGNRYFSSSARKAPRFCENGDLGEEAEIRLELRLIADVGLVGLPNVGKSSILAAISNAQPKIADYPFTTLSPNLGVLTTGYERIVIADIPGLIEGAHMNRGLGIQFLRHIARSRLLLHVLSLECQEFDKLTEELDTVRNEMRSYDPDLDKRPYFVVANKLDELENPEELLGRLSEHFCSVGINFCAVSALTEEGIPELVKHIIDFTEKNPRPRSEVRLYALDSAEDIQSPVRTRNKIQVVSLHGGGFRILHHRLEKAVERYDLSQDENAARFTMMMRKYKVEDLLEAAGAKEGDQITIGPKDFIFYPDYYPSEFEEPEGPDEDESATDTDTNQNQ